MRLSLKDVAEDDHAPHASALKLALIYAAFAALWILLSDRAMGLMFQDADLIVQASMLKGWFFVAITTLLLYFLVRGLVARQQEAYRREIQALYEKQRTHDLLAAIVDHSEDAIFAKDRRGSYLLFNEAASHIVGKPIAEVVGYDDRTIFPAAQAEQLMENDRRVIASGQIETKEETLDTALGRRVFLVTKGPLRDAEKRIFGLFGISRDITEQQHASETLYASEARFRALVEQSLAGIYIIQDRHFRYVNPGFASIFGYDSPAELIDHIPVAELVAPGERDLVREIDHYALEKRYLRKDGSLVWINLTVALVWKPDNTPDYFISVIEDISARKAAEMALQEARRLAGLGRWHWDLRTDVHTWSEEIYAIYGRDPLLAPAVYPEVQQYFTPESWATLASTVEHSMATGKPYECDAEVVRPDGTRRWIIARGEAMRDTDGKLTALHGTVQDITARKLTEMELKRRNEELERFDQASVGREQRMIELKREVNALSQELGRKPPYDLSFVDIENGQTS